MKQLILALALTTLLAVGWAQRQAPGVRRHPAASERSQLEQEPDWELDPEFKNDVFTFVRIRYDAGGVYGGWRNDYPDCDLNLSFRLQQLTSMSVDPDGLVLDLTDERLFDHPFIYMSNVNRMNLTDEEVVALRKYLLNGGFLMADDFWSAPSWRNVYQQMKRVFPDREPLELPRDHKIFNIVYEIQGRLQVPSHDAWSRGYTFEYWHGPTEGDEEPHFQAFFDDRGEICALLCHNNDIGDGWEREGVSGEYFRLYSEKLSYPLGINILVYAMTH